MIKNDRMTMAHSLEARVPFTDNNLVNYLASVPVHYKLKGLKKKFLLRSSFNGMLPKSIIKKKKVGLEMPYSHWFIHEWRDMVEDLLSEAKLNSTGLFNTKGVRQIWAEHQAKKIDHGRALWGLVNYMLWHEIYIEKHNFESYLSSPRAAREKKSL
jgi:asparagine synthase (glutamine-hydrolysing)